MPTEVRYHMLRPHQIAAQRSACPVAYIPIGTLEWHGVHNPVGADTLQAEGLATLAAHRGGGLVFPALYYGENRLEGLMEANAADREDIAGELGLPPESFGAGRQPFSVTEQTYNYSRLLLHILAEADSLGFAVGVLVAGHYPLVDHARAAAIIYNQRQYGAARRMLAWACVDYLLVKDRYPQAGDHAAGWETSHVLALHPKAVDMSLLPARGERVVGVGGVMPPQDASAAFGQETLEAAADVLVKEVQHRLAHRGQYEGHGWSQREGLWRGEEEWKH